MKLLKLAVLVAGLSLNAFAHEGHVHEAAVEDPPHGGLLRDAPPFKSEIVINGDEAKLYIYDKDLKSVKLDQDVLKGDLMFPKEKKPRSISFKRNGELYEAKLTGISKVHRYDMHVHLVVGGKKVLADFGIDNVQ